MVPVVPRAPAVLAGKPLSLCLPLPLPLCLCLRLPLGWGCLGLALRGGRVWGEPSAHSGWRPARHLG